MNIGPILLSIVAGLLCLHIMHTSHCPMPLSGATELCKNRLRSVRGVNHHQRLPLELFMAAFLDPTLGRVSKSKDDRCYIWFLKVAQGIRTDRYTLLVLEVTYVTQRAFKGTTIHK